jgi:hypothetical protein
MQLAAEDEARTEAGPDGQERKVVDPARNAAPTLADRGEVDVVLEDDRDTEAAPEPGPEVAAFEPRHVGREAECAGLDVDDAWDAHDDTVDQVGRPTARVEERGAKVDDRVERPRCIGAAELDVLAGPDLAPQVAERTTQEARPDVQPEHERGVRNRLEVHGAVARPSRVVRRLAHQPGIE